MKKLTIMMVATVLFVTACSETSTYDVESENCTIAEDVTIMDATITTPPSITEDLEVVQIALGAADEQSFYLTADGRVFARGDNFSGALGVGDFDEHEGIVQVEIPEPIRLIGNCVAVTFDNHIYVWGTQYIEDERLRETLAQPEELSSYPFAFVSTPLRIEFGRPVAKIYNSWNFTNILTEDGEVYTFGAGYVGLNTPEPPLIGDYYPSQNPQRVKFSERIIDMTSGYMHTLALGESGVLYGFGEALNEQLGVAARMLVIEQVETYGFEAPENVNDYVVITDSHDISFFAANGFATYFANRNDPALIYATGHLGLPIGLTSDAYPMESGFAQIRFPNEIVEIFTPISDTNVIAMCIDGNLYGHGVFHQDFFNLSELAEEVDYGGGYTEEVAVLCEPTLIETDVQVDTILAYGDTIYFTDTDDNIAVFNSETNRSQTIQFEVSEDNQGGRGNNQGNNNNQGRGRGNEQ
jgi:alpha-tubulin suppressor-like RCC1 family protein